MSLGHSLKCFQIFDDRVFVRGAQQWCHRRRLRDRRSNCLHCARAEWRLPVSPGYRKENMLWIFAGRPCSAVIIEARRVRDEAEFLPDRRHRIRDRKPAGRSLAGIKQIAQRRNRTVMQIRRTQPNAIERQIGVAESLAEMTETPRITRIQDVFCVVANSPAVGIKPMPIGSDHGYWHNLTDPRAGEIASVFAMTICADLGVNFFTAARSWPHRSRKDTSAAHSSAAIARLAPPV